MILLEGGSWITFLSRDSRRPPAGPSFRLESDDANELDEDVRSGEDAEDEDGDAGVECEYPKLKMFIFCGVRCCCCCFFLGWLEVGVAGEEGVDDDPESVAKAASIDGRLIFTLRHAAFGGVFCAAAAPAAEA